MDTNSQKLAQDILAALSGTSEVEHVKHPGEAPPEGSSDATVARYQKALDARHEYLMATPAGKLTAEEKQELWKLSVTALGIRF